MIKFVIQLDYKNRKQWEPLISVILDGDAGVNIIGEHMKDRMGITNIKPAPFRITMADQRIVQPIGLLENLHIKVGSEKFKTSFLILDVQGAYNMLLGRPSAIEAPHVIPDIGASTEHVQSSKDWHQGSVKVMYWLSVSVSDSIVGHIQDTDSSEDAWDNLIAFNATNTRARKTQLKNELNTIKKRDLSVNDYTLKIKALCEFLSSIGVAVDDDDKVEACLRGLANAYRQFKISIHTWKNIPHFLELSSLLVIEEKSVIDDGAIQTRRNSSEKALWTGYVQTRDDTMHPIVHTCDVSLFTRNGKENYLVDVLRVPNITKNLVSVGQMVEQGLQVRFSVDGLYVEEYKKNGKLVAQGKKVGKMFTLNVNMPEMNAAMFTQGTDLPQFRVFEMQQVCAACQLGKQAKGSFPQEIHVQDPIVIYCDNISSIQLARNPVFHCCTKHIEVHYHFIRERVLDDDIDLDYVGTEDQAVDLFTKALGTEKLQRFRGMLRLRDMALSLRGSVEKSSSMLT
ncbi:hypothetical protein L7F22_053625 [Adiantum nelumboides]|nr:hypothetical protein [Adiantum nelumboides]